MSVIYDELEIKINSSLESQKKYEELEKKMTESN